MSKELEAIKYVNELIKNVEEYKNKTGIDKPTICISEEMLITIQNALQRLESIDNSNPSEALEKLDKINNYLNDVYDYKEIKEEIRKDIATIKQALLKAQEQEKVLEIIKEKGVNVGYLKTCKTLDDYNSDCWNDEEDFNKSLTQEEFDLLKRYFK